MTEHQYFDSLRYDRKYNTMDYVYSLWINVMHTMMHNLTMQSSSWLSWVYLLICVFKTGGENH